MINNTPPLTEIERIEREAKIAIADIMLNDPEFAEIKKANLRIIKANWVLRDLLSDLIDLANPDLDEVWDAETLIAVRGELLDALTRATMALKPLAEKHAAIIEKSKELR